MKRVTNFHPYEYPIVRLSLLWYAFMIYAPVSVLLLPRVEGPLTFLEPREEYTTAISICTRVTMNGLFLCTFVTSAPKVVCVCVKQV